MVYVLQAWSMCFKHCTLGTCRRPRVGPPASIDLTRSCVALLHISCADDALTDGKADGYHIKSLSDTSATWTRIIHAAPRHLIPPKDGICARRSYIRIVKIDTWSL